MAASAPLADDDFLRMVAPHFFYARAADAYPHHEAVVVTCDRCGRIGLAACFHIFDKDVCLICAHALTVANRDSCADPARQAPAGAVMARAASAQPGAAPQREPAATGRTVWIG